jgi:protein-disulfide isomerase
VLLSGEPIRPRGFATEVLIQSLRIAKQREQIRVTEQNDTLIASLKKNLVDDPNAPVRGTGDVTVVEFFDYRCPDCCQVEPSLQALIKNNRDLRVVSYSWTGFSLRSAGRARGV